MQTTYHQAVDDAIFTLSRLDRHELGRVIMTASQIRDECRSTINKLLTVCTDQREQINIAQLSAVADYPQLDVKGPYRNG